MGRTTWLEWVKCRFDPTSGDLTFSSGFGVDIEGCIFMQKSLKFRNDHLLMCD